MKEFEIAFPVGKEMDMEAVRAAAAKAMGISPKNVGQCVLLRKSLDARNEILYRYRMAAYRNDETPSEFRLEEFRDVAAAEPVIIIGAGPAGMFAAMKLLEKGFKPVILERGKDVRHRRFDVAGLSREGNLVPDSNYCFGEGGAGTFSDGKLYTRSTKRGDIREVLHRLVQFGAAPEILTDAHPHIGSDRLPLIVENIRKCIEDHGGEYHFGCRVTDIVRKGDRTFDIMAADGSKWSSKKVILATGHSARDIYEMFAAKGWALEAKGFALGVRVEHPQSLINRIRYHGKYQPYMPAAEYSFVTQIEGRGVFSFCMCPGGILVPSSTENDGLVLNGMSNSARNSKWANSGVVVSVEPEDCPEYAGYGALALMHFQRDVEKRMFDVAGSFKAPAQRMMDFCRRVVSTGLPATSYHPGTVSAPLHELLPENVSLRLKYAFPQIGNKEMKGYYTNEALLLGVESRTSSPVRIPRDPETLEHIGLPGLYPCGEGAGYAGGIVSSALDGINCASKIRA